MIEAAALYRAVSAVAFCDSIINRRHLGTLPDAKKLINNTNIPQHTVERIARCILPDIIAFSKAKKVSESSQNVKRIKKD